MSEGFFIAQRLPGGGPGRPIGNDDGAVMVFEDLDKAKEIRSQMDGGSLQLAVFKLNISLAGEVLE